MKALKFCSKIRQNIPDALWVSSPEKAHLSKLQTLRLMIGAPTSRQAGQAKNANARGLARAYAE